MSGIAGIIRFDGAPVAPELVEAMTASMAHRGPDGCNHWRDGPAALGHCMLRTTPESLEERQPLGNEDESLVLTMDGRVDNWEELRADLLAAGARLRDRSDAELVLRAYERWGRDCLDHIDGDFGLVVWDARRRAAFCARDRLGARPFYYHWDGRRLAFASELHAVLNLPDTPEKLNEGLVAEFLAAEFYSRSETLWRGVLRLEPAHALTVDASGPQDREYWFPDLSRVLRYRREEEYIDHYSELLERILRKHSRTHLPLACEVSGGLDSSAIFAVCDRLARDGRLLAPDLLGYTLAFDNSGEADELAYARAVGAHLGRAIFEVPPTRKPLDWFRAEAAGSRDFPGYPNEVMTFGMKQAAADGGSRVMLNGLGGDEWLGGGRKYYAECFESLDPAALVASLQADRAAFGLGRSLRWLLRFGIAPLSPASLKDLLKRLDRASRAAKRARRAWLSPEMAAAIDRRSRAANGAPAPPLGRTGQRDKLVVLFDAFSLHLWDAQERHAAQFGMEMRRPFRDRSFVEFSFALPERLATRGGWTKYLHRRAMRGLLPEPVRNRASKAEFSITFDWQQPDLCDTFQRSDPSAAPGWVGHGAGLSEAERASVRPASEMTRQRVWHLFGCAALAASGIHCGEWTAETQHDR